MDIRKQKDNSYSEGRYASSSFFAEQENPSHNLPQPLPKFTPRQEHPMRKFAFYFLLTLVLVVAATSSYFILKVHSVGKKVIIENESASVIRDAGALLSTILPSKNIPPLRGEKDGRINVLLLGAAGKGKPGQNLTDTIMLASLDTKNKKTALLSLPRDLYVNIPETHTFTKLNSVYQYGLNNAEEVSPIKKVIEEITGLPIHYFLIIDFEGFTKVIDDLGGINVEVERDIFDPRYPGPGYSYETFALAKGLQHLDGATALKYARERHDDPEGDFGRAKRQQKVIQAVKNKVFSLETFLDVFKLNKLLNTLGEHVKTDINLEDIEGFIGLVQELDLQNISNAVVDAWQKDSLLKVSHVFFGGVRAFVLVPRVGNYSEIQDLAANVFNLKEIERRKNEINQEKASLAILNRSGDKNIPAKIKNLLENKLYLGPLKTLSEKGNFIEARTTVIDQTQGTKIFTLDELLKRLPATLASKNNGILDTGNDLVIVLGKDLVPAYSFEEDSLEEFKKAEDKQEYQINNQ